MTLHHFTPPRWIFFDLDDTLWDFEGNSLRSLKFIYESFDFIRLHFKSFNDFIDEYHIHNSRMWRDFADGKISSAFIRTERWRETLFPDSDRQSSLRICSEINDRYLQRLAEFPFAVEGAHELLGDLSKENLIAVISNGFTDTQYRKLNFSGLWRYITRVIISDEIGIQKPDPRIFQYAIDETGAQGRHIMIGDNADTDIIGALSAGWNAIWFNPSGKAFPYSATDLLERGIDPSLYLGETATLAETGRLLAGCHSVK